MKRKGWLLVLFIAFAMAVPNIALAQVRIYVEEPAPVAVAPPGMVLVQYPMWYWWDLYFPPYWCGPCGGWIDYSNPHYKEWHHRATPHPQGHRFFRDHEGHHRPGIGPPKGSEHIYGGHQGNRGLGAKIDPKHITVNHGVGTRLDSKRGSENFPGDRGTGTKVVPPQGSGVTHSSGTGSKVNKPAAATINRSLAPSPSKPPAATGKDHKK